jgi:signal transduction histidine kinase
VLIRRVAERNILYLLLALLHATLYLVLPDVTALLIPWALFLLLSLAGLFLGGSVERKALYSISFLLLLSGLLFVMWNSRRINRAEAGWDALYPEVIEGLREAVNDRARDHLEERLLLLSEVQEGVAALREQEDQPEVLRRDLFRLLHQYRVASRDFEDLVFIFSTFNGENLAWSGDIYIRDDGGTVSEGSSDPLSIRLLRGNIFTAAAIAVPIPDFGILTLYDHLDLEHHLSSRYSGSGRFIDRMSRRFGTDLSLFPIEYQGSLEGERGALIFPFIVRSEHIGNWLAEPIAKEGYIADLKSFENRFLPIFLLIPWLLSFLLIREKLEASFLGRGRSPVRGRILYIGLLGGFVFLLRLVFLWVSFPSSWSSWIGEDYFSSRSFATGFFAEGSISIGEFFISGLFISLFLLYVYTLMTGWVGDPSGRGKKRNAWMASGPILAILLSIASPFVHERLLRDSLSSMVIEQAFIQSRVTVFWEFGFFLLSLPLFLLVAICLRPLFSSGNRYRLFFWMNAIAVCLLFSLEIVLAQYGYGSEWRVAHGLVTGCFVLAGGALITYLTIPGESGVGGKGGWINFRTVIILSLLSAALIYPGLLRYRHLTLEETGEDLVERIGAPYDNRATFVLEEVVDVLANRREEILSEQRDPQGLGFHTWVNSNLSRIGQRTDLTIFDGEGKEVSSFSLTDFEIDRDLSAFFLGRARKTDESFIYHGFKKGKEFYTAVVPYWFGGTLRRYLTVTLPTDLEERLGGGPIRLFTDDSADNRWSVPEPMEIREISFDGEESGIGDGWSSAQDESGRYRFYRKKVEVGGTDKILEVVFQVQGVWESLARVNFLFVLHFCLMVFLWGIVSGGFRDAPLRWSFLIGTFHKKLQVALIFFSVVPTLLLGLGGAGEIRKRLDFETRSKAADGIESFIHLLERELSSQRTGDASGEIQFVWSGEDIYLRSGSSRTEAEAGLRLDSRYVRELGNTIGRDILIYRDYELVASSQEDLIQAGMVPRFMEERSYVDMVLGEKNIAYHRQSLGNYQYLVGNFRVTPFGAENPIILSTPMLWRQEEVEQEVARLKYIVLMIIIGILFLASGVGVIVSAHLTRPIALLKDAFARVGSGDFRIDLEKGSGEEFDRLFVSFEQMSRQLETSQSRLSEEKARLDGILQSVGAGIMAFGNDGKLKIVNTRATTLLDVNLIEQVGRDLEAITFPDPGWLELIRGVREVMKSEKSGIQREFNITSGEEARTIRMNANRLTSETGESQGAVIAFEDITDTIRSQKIVAWGEMARQVAHEIKNPLTPIRLSIQHLYKTFKDGAPDFQKILDDEVRIILREIDRLRNIAGDFSRYSKPETVDVQPIDVASVISEVRELYEKEHGDITYSFELGEGEVRGMASEEGLKRVLVNLIENGREAIDGRGQLRVEVKEEERSNVVKIIVTDTGRGIPSADIGRIFDPSFSTRSGGTGLGLAICKRIVDEWGGEIEISSREGEGTRVEVRIRCQSG